MRGFAFALGFSAEWGISPPQAKPLDFLDSTIGLEPSTAFTEGGALSDSERNLWITGAQRRCQKARAELLYQVLV